MSEDNIGDIYSATEDTDLNRLITEISLSAKAHNISVSAILLKTKDGRRGFNPLHVAAFRGNLPAVKYILAQQPAMIDLTDYEGNTPLHWASKTKNSAVLSFILSKSVADARYLLSLRRQSPMLLSLDATTASNFNILFEGAHWDEVRIAYSTHCVYPPRASKTNYMLNCYVHTHIHVAQKLHRRVTKLFLCYSYSNANVYIMYSEYFCSAFDWFI